MVCRTAHLARFSERGQPLLCLRCQRWNAAIGRIDDERGAPGRHDARAGVPPEVVVGARDIRFGRAVASIAIGALERLPFVFRGLFR